MAGYQHVMIIGNVGKEPELKTIGTGSQVCKFSVAVNERWKDKSGEKQERAEWFNVVAWGTLARVCSDYLHKGSPVSVEGTLKTRSYDDERGIKRYMTDLVAKGVTFLGSKGEGGVQPGPMDDAPVADDDDFGVPF